jgi:hypothetical protein
MRFAAFLTVSCIVSAACAPKPVVAIKPGFDFTKLGAVALLDFSDAAGQSGSGVIVSESLEPFLLKAGYDLIERAQVDKVLNEQSFSHTENVDPQTAESLGKVLGVKAVVLGTVTSITQATSNTVMQTVQNVNYQPVYQTVQYTAPDGSVRSRSELSQYDVVTTNDQIPVTYTTPATLAFSARLVDAETGSVLWTGSVASDGDSLSEAATSGSQRLVAALKKAWPVAR